MVDPIDESSPDQGSKPDFFIDGGVIANNPVMQSLTLALTEVWDNLFFISRDEFSAFYLAISGQDR